IKHSRHLAQPTYFNLIIPPPPKSTLFPYTTLFRSYRQVARRQRLLMRALRGGTMRTVILDVRPPADSMADFVRIWKQGKAAGSADRKSTRLNSSHVSISYAVFCLKKKIENY